MKANSLIPFVVIVLVFAFAGCSGGGNSTPPGPQLPPQVSISVSPTSATVPSGQTQQFTATVTGSSNTAVAWSASAGSISSSGLFTAPATSSNISATVTATAQADATKSAQATVTVTPPPTPTTTSVVSPFNNNSPFISLPNLGTTSVKLLGSGFASTDNQVVSPSMPFTSRVFVSSTEFDLGLGFDNAHFRTGFYTLADCNANCSNPPASFAFFGDGLSRLSMGTDGRFCQRDAGTAACFNADRSAAGSSFAVGNFGAGIAFDNANNLLAVAGAACGPVCLYDLTDPVNKFSSANVSGSVKGISQRNGTGCVAQPSEGIVTIFPVDPTLHTSVSSPPGTAGAHPWSVDMAQIGTDLECVSIATDGTLARFSTADGSVKGSLAITGLTSGGTPRVVTFNSGSATGTAAVLSPADSLIVFVNLGTMAEIRRVTAVSTATNHVAQIIADETAGDLIIIFANVNGGTTMSTFAKLTIASGNPVPYTGPNSTAALLFMDVAVSPVSPTIIGGSFGQNAAIPVQ